MFIAPPRKENPVEGMRGCSRLSCIKSAIEHVSRISPAINVRLMVFPIIYKGGHARGKEPARETRIDYGYLQRRAKEGRTNQAEK